MDVTNQFQQIWVFLADDGLIAVLEEVSTSPVTYIECYCISGHESAHDLAERCRTGTQQDMKVIWDQRPRVTLGLCFLEDQSESFQK